MDRYQKLLERRRRYANRDKATKLRRQRYCKEYYDMKKNNASAAIQMCAISTKLCSNRILLGLLSIPLISEAHGIK